MKKIFLFRHVFASVTAVSFCVAEVSHAQTLTQLPANTRIRVILPDSLRQGSFSPKQQFIAGELVRVTTDSLTMRVKGAGDLSMPLLNIRQIRASRGASRGRSAFISGVALGAAGLLVVNASRRYTNNDMWVAGGVGLGVGAIMGAISPFETWRRIKR